MRCGVSCLVVERHNKCTVALLFFKPTCSQPLSPAPCSKTNQHSITDCLFSPPGGDGSTGDPLQGRAAGHDPRCAKHRQHWRGQTGHWRSCGHVRHDLKRGRPVVQAGGRVPHPLRGSNDAPPGCLGASPPFRGARRHRHAGERRGRGLNVASIIISISIRLIVGCGGGITRHSQSGKQSPRQWPSVTVWLYVWCRPAVSISSRSQVWRAVWQRRQQRRQRWSPPIRQARA